MIDRAILATANRIRNAYARQSERMTHYRVSAAHAAIGARGPTSAAIPLSAAIADAKAIHRAADLGLSCSFEADDLPWDGDCPAPKLVLCGIVRDDDNRIRAVLGGIGVDSETDPYLMSCEADLYREAIADIEAENDKRATEAANELASRATYAAGGA